MIFLDIHSLNTIQKKALRILWNNEYPEIIKHDTLKDFEEYIDSLKNINHTIIIKNDLIIGWYADFIRNDERWFLMILDIKFQGKGIGREVLEKAKKKYSLLNGWVVISNTYLKTNNQLYQSPIKFYKKLGFTIFENITLNSASIKAIKIQFTR